MTIETRPDVWAAGREFVMEHLDEAPQALMRALREEFGVDTGWTASAIRKLRFEYGGKRINNDASDLIPGWWRPIDPRHKMYQDFVSLRILSRRLKDEVIPDAQNRRLDAWLRKLQGINPAGVPTQFVVDYNKETGPFWVERRRRNHGTRREPVWKYIDQGLVFDRTLDDQGNLIQQEWTQ